MNKKINIYFVLIILLISFLLRLYKVEEIPPSVNWDEAAIGYNAYSILKTGRDEWGEFFPLHFKSYGEYKLPAQVYASIPGIMLFGLNEFGVRITPVIYGTLTILAFFFFARSLFKNETVALISAFLLGISPWHIQLTRASFESSFSVFWVILGMWFLIKGFEEKKWLVLSAIPFAISIFTYNSARVFTPLFLFIILILYRKTLIKFKRAVVSAIILFTVLMIPLTPFILGSERSARYKLVSITDDPGLVLRINEGRGASKLPEPLPRLVHNKATYISVYFARNYISHFTPQFLFISGAPHKQHHVQNMGQLYLFQAPFLLIGLIFLFKSKFKFLGFLLSWILIIYIPVSVTNDSIPHALRTVIAAPFYQLVTAFGVYNFYLWIKDKKLIFKGTMFIFLFYMILHNFSNYFINYFFYYPIEYSRDWQYGYKQVVGFIEENKNKYDQIIFSRHYGEPHMFTLFYLNYPPDKYQTDPKLIRFETHDWVRVLRFDKFYFPDLGDDGTKYEDIIAKNPNRKLLFIGKNGDFPTDIPRLKVINFLNGKPAFEIVEKI